MRTIKATLLALVGLALGAALAEAAEKSEAQKKLLAKYDANKDGRLSASEREKIRFDKLNPPKEQRRNSERRRFRYPDPVIAKFDTDDDNELDEKEFGEARKWVDRRFKEITAEYDVNKDGRLHTSERATVAKDVEAGKFKTMDWLMKYVTRPPSRRGDRYRDMREEPREKARMELFRKHDTDKDGRLNESELANVRAALKKYRAERDQQRKSAGEKK